MEESKEAYALIEANQNYAIFGEDRLLPTTFVKLSMKTGANAEKYEAEIAKLYSELKALRK